MEGSTNRIKAHKALPINVLAVSSAALLLGGCSEGTTNIVGINLTLFLQALSLVFVIFFMKKFVYKKVLEMLDKRRDEIAGNIKSAEDLRAEAQKLKEDYDAMIKDAYTKADSIRKEITEGAQADKARIVESGRLELEHMKVKAEQELALELSKAKSELMKSVADVSVKIASAILKEEIDGKKHQKMINDVIGSIGEGEKREK